MENSYRFFNNKDCKYFPCHEGVDISEFNCLFCYCPIHSLGSKCGGNFEYIGENNNIKNCTNCNLPHKPEFYDIVISKLKSK